MGETKPKPRYSDRKSDPEHDAHGRYGTQKMNEIFGAEQTFVYSLYVQGQASLLLGKMGYIPLIHAAEIVEKASLKYVDPARIRELENKSGHDVIALNDALGEVLSPEAKPHVNKGRTSADTTVTARAVQLKSALEVIIDSLENLRDIVLEKSMEWIDCLHMDQTHRYDALPTVVGRPFSFYAEMIQSDLDVLKFFYGNSLVGKWGDATGNHHALDALGIDGMAVQEEYCRLLGLKHMIAPAQLPGLEFEADVIYGLARTAGTLDNLARYIAEGRGDDRNIFVNKSPQKQKGSSAMPHKDSKNGNPTAEEQMESFENGLLGNMATALSNIQFAYGRDLSASANGRMMFEDAFKTMDMGINRIAHIMYWLGVNEDVAASRVTRSYGVPTSARMITYLTDAGHVAQPLARPVAHDMMGILATKAWDEKREFVDVLLEDSRVTSLLSESKIREAADPTTYIGQSKAIVQKVYDEFHGVKTLEKG